MSFVKNYTNLQAPNYTRDDEGVMYTEIKSDEPDAGGITCILDRTQEDVDRVKYLTRQILTRQATEDEFKEFQKNLKGALNYSDLDRIEYNMYIIKSMFSYESGGFEIDLEDMDRDYIPRVSYFPVLLRNTQAIRDTMYILSTTPEVPEMPLNHFKDWNDIEQILYDVYWMKRRFERSFYYTTASGSELSCGGNFLI